MTDLSLDFAVVDRKDGDVLPERGTRNGKYHLKDVIVTFLGEGLIRVVGTQLFWDYWSQSHDYAILVLHGVKQAAIGEINIPPHANWPFELRPSKVPWYKKLFGGSTPTLEKMYYDGWFQTGERPFNLVIHSSRLTGWDDRCKICGKPQYEQCERNLHGPGQKQDSIP